MTRKPSTAGRVRQRVNDQGGVLPEQGDGLENACGRCRKERRGAAIVEFAVVAPVLFLLIFGMIEYGRMVMVQQVLTNASREAARQAVLDGATYSAVNSFVSSYLTSAAIPAAAVQPITMSPSDPSTAAYGAPITVTVSVNFNQVSWLPSPIWLGGQVLRATTTMRKESAS
jgi:Flp pilus assembly protein TadG